ncbi:hypothetical protein N0V82_010499 [Gnomoniopsis sp. IMI 355080]|nr:hypothetical protein N0V82_010499 [Gnomoniopsis sp. IMI 355080]
MSYAKSPATMNQKLRRRFYEPVVFLHAVTRAWQLNRQAVSHDFASVNTGSLEVNFKEFVNRLSQFCDIKLGGDFVTAFTVLDREDRIQYRFACNRAGKSQLERASAFVTDLLTTLRDGEASNNLDQVLLEKVLAHCRFEKAAKEADFGKLDLAEFAQRCKILMKFIEECKQRKLNVLAERPAHSNMSQSSNCWSTIRHYAWRLLSYFVGIRTMVTAVRNSPRLVEHFEVVFVRSSDPDANPLLNKSVTADEILRRMVPDPAQAVQYSALLAEIRSIDMNKTIQDIIGEANFRPIVHAELLVLQSLEKDELTHPSNFFNSWKYIGSSKPTCRLCHWYFEHHGGGFQVRPTHGNLYINWKPPDVLRGDGEDALKAREKMLNTMNVHIRKEGLRTLIEKVPMGRLHDSSTGKTFSAINALAERPSGEIDMETSFGDQEDAAVD